MTKFFYKEIEKCNQCPNCKCDANIVALECDKANRRICWISEEESTNIPNWCPLQTPEEFFNIGNEYYFNKVYEGT